MAEETKSVFKAEVSKSRLEFLFDGVFAIALYVIIFVLWLWK